MAQVRASAATRKRKESGPAPTAKKQQLEPRELFPVHEDLDLTLTLEQMKKLTERYIHLQKIVESIEKETAEEKKKEKALYDLQKELTKAKNAVLPLAQAHPLTTERWGGQTTTYFSTALDGVTASLLACSSHLEAIQRKHQRLAPVVKQIDDTIPEAVRQLPVGACPVCFANVLGKQPHVVLPCGHLLCWKDYAALPAVERVLRGGQNKFERNCPLCRAVIPRVDASTRSQIDMIREQDHEPVSPTYQSTSDEHLRTPSYEPTSPNYAPSDADDLVGRALHESVRYHQAPYEVDDIVNLSGYAQSQ